MKYVVALFSFIAVLFATTFAATDNGDTDDDTGTPGAEDKPGKDTDDQPKQVSFTPEQQAHIDKVIGERLNRAKEKWQSDQDAAKQKADQEAEQKRLKEEKEYEKLISQHEAKIGDLEPQVKTLSGKLTDYEQTVTDILASRLESLGDKARTALDNLPGEPDALARLKWLNANEALFGPEQETPARGTPPRRASKMQQARQHYADRQPPEPDKPVVNF